MQKEFVYQEYVQRENAFVHAPYEDEFTFYKAVQAGDIAMLKELRAFMPYVEKTGLGTLSKDPLRNVIYHFVITVAMIARFCIEGGMSHEEAYTLSDYYIQRADTCTKLEQINNLHCDMVEDYTRRMHRLCKERIFSKPIARSLDYIYDHLHTRILMEELAEYVGLSASYFSRLFKQETGSSVSEYIQNKKIETAENMLRYSEYSISEIASILAFPTQSYFTEVFRKRLGITPKKYCQQYNRQITIGQTIQQEGKR